MDAAAAWQRVESSPGLVGAVLAQLSNPEDLARAAGVSTLWRETANDDRAWERTCAALPLLAQLKSESWCELSWRQLFVQQRRCDHFASSKDRPTSCIGPRLELDHYPAGNPPRPATAR